MLDSTVQRLVSMREEHVTILKSKITKIRNSEENSKLKVPNQDRTDGWTPSKSMSPATNYAEIKVTLI